MDGMPLAMKVLLLLAVLVALCDAVWGARWRRPGRGAGERSGSVTPAVYTEQSSILWPERT